MVRREGKLSRCNVAPHNRKISAPNRWTHPANSVFIVSPYSLIEQLCALADWGELDGLVYTGNVVVPKCTGDEYRFLLPLFLGLRDRTQILRIQVAARAARVTRVVVKGVEKHPDDRVRAMAATDYHDFVAAISLHGSEHFVPAF